MSDVIAAISTGNVVSAIGILRLTGPGCARVAGKVFLPQNGRPLWEAKNRMLTMGSLLDTQGRVIDQCLAVYTRGPGSYTGEDTVEIQCHGSPAVLAAGLEALYQSGARPARRGEFTKRAFLNGRMGLTQAEAVIDLIEAETADAAANAAGQVAGVLQQKLAPVYNDLTDLCSHFHAVLDYPDEDIEDFGLDQYETTLSHCRSTLASLLSTYHRGRILRGGVRVALVGKPNVGKSSLLNALAGFDRAIVTDVAGTTRDTVEESILLGSTRLRLIDTAGIRDCLDPIEAMGVERSRAAAQEADLILFLFDGSKPLDEEDRQVLELCAGRKNVIALANKRDLGTMEHSLAFDTVIPISAKTGEGLDLLTAEVEALFASNAPCDGSLLTNTRQFDAIRRSQEALDAALSGLAAGYTPDAVLLDVETAMEAMGEVTGAVIREDITSRIFERFCVGK